MCALSTWRETRRAVCGQAPDGMLHRRGHLSAALSLSVFLQCTLLPELTSPSSLALWAGLHAPEYCSMIIILSSDSWPDSLTGWEIAVFKTLPVCSLCAARPGRLWAVDCLASCVLLFSHKWLLNLVPYSGIELMKCYSSSLPMNFSLDLYFPVH